MSKHQVGQPWGGGLAMWQPAPWRMAWRDILTSKLSLLARFSVLPPAIFSMVAPPPLTANQNVRQLLSVCTRPRAGLCHLCDLPVTSMWPPCDLCAPPDLCNVHFDPPDPKCTISDCRANRSRTYKVCLHQVAPAAYTVCESPYMENPSSKKPCHLNQLSYFSYTHACFTFLVGSELQRRKRKPLKPAQVHAMQDVHV